MNIQIVINEEIIPYMDFFLFLRYYSVTLAFNCKVEFSLLY